ncbi:MAG TPA: 3-oxoacyl-ACP reductase family protein [Thermomicrobiales bacterium]|nr:3-oxoacyl-ACP reductase family protein [Thermomicrobiales bacterium]
MKLAGKVALVTGGGRGNGRAIALGLAREGADVAVNYVAHPDAARDAAREIEGLGRRAAAVRANTADAGEVARMVAEVVERFGRVDILVNNAGVLTRTPFLEIGEDEWDRILDVNLKGYFLVGQAVARRMVAQGGGGHIINISSGNQFNASPNLAHYCASKGGVGLLTKTMALELAPHGIRVNAIAPGLIETDMNRHDIARDDFRAARLARIPLRTIGRPEDLVGVAVLLASDDARLITGATFSVDGGSTL